MPASAVPASAAPAVPALSFQTFSAATAAHVVAFVFDDLELPGAIAGRPGVTDAVRRAAEIEHFKGKAQATLDVLMPESAGFEKLSLIGLGARDALAQVDWTLMGGVAGGKVKKGRAATVFAVAPNAEMSPQAAADVALGLLLRGYSFDTYKTKKKPEDENGGPTQIGVAVANTANAKKAFAARAAIADGVMLARTLVNEPPNVLNPPEFAARAEALTKVGCEVEVMGEKKLKKLGFGALLGVGQGSHNESHVVVMRWNGAKNKDAKPVAFIGKGVTFDTGGISIKPAGGMEDMKGDMAGAACVTGLMHALAARKAKVNAIGVIGLVENMPDGKAQRPGDIVTSLSGQTIEIINTDAEGRLVLADVLWHVQDVYKPQFMINLATLTGAIMVALGQEHAGLFSNDDALADRITAAGKATGEKVWRMPLNAEYDKMMDSKFADVKNSGGRYAGAITAAQFLQRFVNGCTWAHLDVAGTAMGSPSTPISQGWASGWGVRLLDRLVADHYEE